MDEPARLTIKQERFCKYYVVNTNGTQAAIKAGYSEDSAAEIASENLRKPQIRARIDVIEDEALEASQLSPEWVLKMLKANAVDCAGSEDGSNPAASNKALELIGKHMAMFVERKEIDIEGSINLSHMTEDQLNAIATGEE